MSYAERHAITLTTNSSGDGVAYVPATGSLTGRVHSIQYVKANYENGVDFLVTSEATGAEIWNEDDVNDSATVYPRALVQDTKGEDSTVGFLDAIAIAHDRLKVTIANGGNGTSGTFTIIVV